MHDESQAERFNDVDALRTNIILMSKLEANQKIDTSGRYYVIQRSSMLTPFVRLYNGQNRSTTVDALSTLIDTIEDCCKRDWIEFKRLKQLSTDEMGSIKKGFSHLKITYADCVTTVSRIDALEIRLCQIIELYSEDQDSM